MNILFVCTGNVFRSMAAEYCLKDYLKKRNMKDIYVDSAGTQADIESVSQVTLDALKRLGIDASAHRQTRLSIELLESHDLVVAMSQTHKDFIRKYYGMDVPLFNEIAYGKSTSVDDVNEAVVDYRTNRKAHDEYIASIINYIHAATPTFAENARRIVTVN